MKNKLRSIGLASLTLASFNSGFSQVNQHPNIVLILTDDQGYGDLGITGNPHIKTPVIDKFFRESIRFNNFHVSPVSAPTRSSLLTGRYSLRTGIRDTYNGGAIMASNEITIAEMLKQANYKTGIFGKWHLGDNYPCRPMDQGFDESLVHLSGGMGQPGDITTYFKEDSCYFNPVLWHNGKEEAYKGYCSDIFAGQAIDFIEKNHNSSFFCYLSFNAPHVPLQVPEKYYQMYKDLDPASGFENDKRPFAVMSAKDKEDARRVYAMVTNIDENIGKLLQKLDELKLTKNTIVIFMTDNGPQQTRYIAGLRGLKGSVYEGGVKVPFYLRYPAMLIGNRDIETTAAHIDVLPTLAQLCNVEVPKDRTIDGKSLVPVLKNKAVSWGNRPLFFYWTRRYPELYNNVALQKGRYKLVGHTDYNSEIRKFELYDIEKDPFELNNIVNTNPPIASDLKSVLDSVFRDLVNSVNLTNPPRIIVGSKYENPVILNRNDADGQAGIGSQEDIYGMWRVSILEGTYNIKFKFLKPVKSRGQMVLETKTFINQMQYEKSDTDIIDMKNVHLPKMDCNIIPYYSIGPRKILPFWIVLDRIDSKQ
jgi:arylsulfatase A-like enzyme